MVETCDSWRQAHSSSARRIADLEAQLAAFEISAGEDSGSQTSRQHTEDRTGSQPIRGDAEESDDDDEDEDEEDEEAKEDDE